MTWVTPSFSTNHAGAGTNQGFSMTYLRLLRLLKLTKVIRIFRVMKFFNELNVLLQVVSSTLRPLFWCTCMLLVFFYIFAVIFVNGTAAFLALESSNTTTKVYLKDHFGSVPQ